MRVRTRQVSAALLPVLVVLLGQTAAPAAAQEPVGRTVLVRGDVQGTPPGRPTAALAVGDGVVLDHRVETGQASAARMTLDPDGVLSMGQNTRLTVDRATIDRATGRSESTLSLLLGRIELALGSLFRGEVTVETPTASLGIKGTVLRVLVDASGRTLVAVLEGVVEVTSKATGVTVIVRAGSFTLVEPGASPLPPAPFDPAEGTLSPAAGGPDFTVPGEDLFPHTPLLPEEQRELPREPPSQGPAGQGREPPGAGRG